MTSERVGATVVSSEARQKFLPSHPGMWVHHSPRIP